MPRGRWIMRWAGGGMLASALVANAETPAPPNPTHGSPSRFEESQGQTYAVDWPTVLQLSRANGSDVEMAAAKLQEAEANVRLARTNWYPSLRVGWSWLHHEGRIQDIPGEVITASKSALFAGPLARLTLDPATVASDVLRAKQLVRVRSEQLQRASRQHVHDVCQAYIDLQGAQAAGAVLTEATDLLQQIVDRATSLRAAGVLSAVDLEAYRTEVSARGLDLATMRQRHRAAGLKLADLIGAERNLRLYSAEEFILPLQLVALDAPVDDLIARAQTYGPGIAELQAILQSLEEQACLARKYRFAPQIAVDVGGGGFGGGTGGTYGNWGGRNDLGAHVYWDLSDALRAKQKSDVYQAKRRQSDIGLNQTRQKIEVGVRVMVDQAERSRDRLQLAEAQIQRVLDQHPKVRKLRDAAEPNTSQIISAFTLEAKTVGDLAKARQAYLEALLDYNRAQVTLYHLVGVPEVPDAPVESRSAPRGSAAPVAPGERPDAKPGAAPTASRPGAGGGARPKGQVQRLRGPVPRVPTDER